MERRVLLAIFLAFLVLYTWEALFVKPIPKPVTGKPPGTAASASTGAAPAESSVGTPAAPAADVNTPAARAEANPPPTAAASLVGETAERDVRVETREVIAVF